MGKKDKKPKQRKPLINKDSKKQLDTDFGDSTGKNTQIASQKPKTKESGTHNHHGKIEESKLAVTFERILDSGQIVKDFIVAQQDILSSVFQTKCKNTEAAKAKFQPLFDHLEEIKKLGETMVILDTKTFKERQVKASEQFKVLMERLNIDNLYVSLEGTKQTPIIEKTESEKLKSLQETLKQLYVL